MQLAVGGEKDVHLAISIARRRMVGFDILDLIVRDHLYQRFISDWARFESEDSACWPNDS
jgi:hypothetical protein